MVGRVALIDADARIRLAMQACRALTSAFLAVVQLDSVDDIPGDARSAASSGSAGALPPALRWLGSEIVARGIP
jgi:hypothetical protein